MTNALASRSELDEIDAAVLVAPFPAHPPALDQRLECPTGEGRGGIGRAGEIGLRDLAVAADMAEKLRLERADLEACVRLRRGLPQAPHDGGERLVELVLVARGHSKCVVDGAGKRNAAFARLTIVHGCIIFIHRCMNSTERAEAASHAGPAVRAAGGTFRSLRGFNYRTWAIGALVSNVGTWMQRTAQDWLVLTQLTHRNATAVGTVMALQFGPQVLLLPLTGYAADHFDRRKLLFATQAAMGALATILGILTITGVVRLWHVFVFAFLLGCATAFDAPARHTFVAELVGEDDVSNAVALNSASFSAGRMIGPAVAGLLVAAVGSGWVFVLNGASFVAVLVSLGVLRLGDLHRKREIDRGRSRLADGFRYLRTRPDLQAYFLMLFLVGTFGLNFPIFISTMAVTVFHKGASQYGLLTSFMAVGTITGALLAAGRAKPRVGLLVAGAGIFGIGVGLAAIMPTYALFGVALVGIGVSAQTFTTSVNSVVQLSTDPAMRGRVMAIFLAIALGGTPIGAPIVGRVADTFGPRWAMGVAAVAGVCAALIGLRYLAKYGHLPFGGESPAASAGSPPAKENVSLPGRI